MCWVGNVGSNNRLRMNRLPLITKHVRLEHYRKENIAWTCSVNVHLIFYIVNCHLTHWQMGEVTLMLEHSRPQWKGCKFCRQHFPNYFLELKFSYFALKFTEMCSLWTTGKCITLTQVMAWCGPGPRLNIKTVLSTYGDFHVKDKTAVRTSYL